MSQPLYGQLNQAYLLFLKKLARSFQHIQPLLMEYAWANTVLTENALTDEIYNKLSPQLQLVSERIHLKDESVIKENVPILTCLYVQDYYHLFIEQEKSFFWHNLKDIVQKIGMIQSCLPLMPLVNNMIGKMDPNKKLPSYMELISMFLQQEDSNKLFDLSDKGVLADLPNKMRAIGLTSIGCETVPEEDDDEEEDKKEDKEKEKDKQEQKKQSCEASDILDETLKTRKKHRRRKKGISRFAEVANAMEQEKFEEADVEKMKEIMKEIVKPMEDMKQDMKDMKQDIKPEDLIAKTIQSVTGEQSPDLSNMGNIVSQLTNQQPIDINMIMSMMSLMK